MGQVTDPGNRSAPRARPLLSARREMSASMDSQTYEAILTAASELMSSAGYHNVTVDDIRSHAGVSRTTFYFYFRDKKHVFMTIMERITADLYELSRARFPSLRGYGTVFLSNYYYLTIWSKTPRLLVDYTVLSWTDEDVIGFRRSGGYMKLFTERLERRLTREMQQGSIPATDPAILAQALTNMVQGFCLEFFSEAREPSQQQERLLRAAIVLSETWTRAVGLTPPENFNYARLLVEFGDPFAKTSVNSTPTPDGHQEAATPGM